VSATHAWGKIPEHLRGGLARYLIFGVRTGSALQAFLENDLLQFVSYANEQTLAGLQPMTKFLCNYTPRGCYGHPGVTENWRSLSLGARVVSLRNADCGPAFDAMCADAGESIPPAMLAADYVIGTMEANDA
jgi:hypothetical protein